MILHYFKVALRNHLRYKVQSAITLFSLAVAFALVSLAAYWSVYEQTYDSFLPGYERIYQIGHQRLGDTHITDFTDNRLPDYLMEKYPEVDKACGVWPGWDKDRMVEVNGQTYKSESTEITPECADVLDIKWVEGNGNVKSWKENEVAISEDIAQKVCSKESPIGLRMILKKENGVETDGEYQIAAVFKTRSKHSNFKFNILTKMPSIDSPWEISLCDTYVRLKSNTDPELFLQKLTGDTIVDTYGRKSMYNVLVPLQEVHYTTSNNKRNIRMNDVNLFAGAAVLLSVCALLNYLTLFISRLRNRGRDMALRTICGSSTWQTGTLLMVEYLLLLFGSLFVSLVFIELFFDGFVELSLLEVNRSTVYAGCSYLLLFILAFSAILSFIPILYFKGKTLRVQMEVIPIQLGKNRFRIAGVCMQLFISLLFIFCSSVMIKQIHYLIHADINVERKNIAMISSHIGDDQIMDILKQLPLITEMVPTFSPIFPPNNIQLNQIKGFEGKEDLVIPAREVSIDSDIARFYGLKMKDGPESFDLKFDEYFINETFAKQLGDPNPIGKTFPHFFKGTIKGIVYDFHYQPPTEQTHALYFKQHWKTDRSTEYGVVNKTVAFKYTGDFSKCQAAIEKAFEHVEEIPMRNKYWLEDGETVYNSYLTSEFNLLKLLNIVTIISVLIALFGVYALILQECERQRKNIAIRKVYGAQVKDILMMFFKEYLMQVVIAAAFAFPIGYVLMKRWLEGYGRQTSIGIEVFLGIFIGMAFLVLLCIGWHVWRAANENPATAVKKE